MTFDFRDTYAVLGPPQGGKSALIAALQLAARNVDEAAWGANDVDVETECDATRELFHQFASVIRDQEGRLQIPASDDVVTYELTLRIRRRGMLRRKERQQRFAFIDAPGGVMTNNGGGQHIDHVEMCRFRQRVVAALCEADGFILCVDPNDKDVSAGFFGDLPRLLGQVRRLNGPFKRIVICLTKADIYFNRYGDRAQYRADTNDPVPLAHRLLTGQGMSTLRSLAISGKDTKIGYCWTSIYGFVGETGHANLDPERGGLAVSARDYSSTDIAATWRPYNVIEPFIFASTGRAEGVVAERALP